MRKNILIILFLVMVTQVLAGSTYYVDAVNGNDSNGGQSESNAWRTLNRIRSQSFSPGDTVLLKRGQVWREALVLENITGTSSSPVTVGAYGSGTKPQINGASITTGWSLDQNKIYKKALAYETRVVTQDDNLLTYCPWDGSVSATFAGASAGSWSCNPNNNTAYVWCTDGADPDNHKMEVAAAGRNGIEEYGIRVLNSSYLTIQDLEVINTTYSGVKIMPDTGEKTNGIVVRRLQVSNTGSIGIEANNSRNSSAGNNEITDLIVAECLVHDTNWHGIALLYEVVGAKIQDNTVYRTGWSQDASHGITSWSSVSNAYVRDCIIEGNTVYEVRARAEVGTEGTGIHADDLTRDCIYRYNISFNNDGAGLYFNGTSGCKYHYNICYGNGRAPAGSYRAGITMTQPVDIEVYNNVLFDNYPCGLAWMDSATDGVKIKNNIFIDNGDYEIRSGVSSGLNVAIDYNCVYHSAGGKFMKWLGTDCTWTEWQNRSGQDAHSINADPRFISLSNKNFNLQSSSPCIDAGTNVGLTKDINSISVPQGQRVDIGACEFESSAPPALNATASGSPTSGTNPLTVNFTGNASGGTSPYSYHWDFGDGETSTTINPSHTYNQAGPVTATLTVTDNAGQEDTDTVNISVNASTLTATITASPKSGQVPLTVDFTRTVSGGTSPFTYQWNFGDGGTSTVNNPTHTYNQAGNYTVTLTVTDNTGQKATDTETISATAPSPLNVSLNANPTAGQAPLTVNFSRNVTGGISPYTTQWDFGDGSTSNADSPSYTYNQGGTFTVTVTVSDNSGQQDSDTGTIAVSAPAGFNVSMSAEPTSGTAPLTVEFSRNVSGGLSPYTYYWDFGDGSTSSVNNPTHTYEQVGDYTVTLTVTDNSGQQKSDTGTISVYSQQTTTYTLSLSSSTGSPAPGSGGSISPSPGNHSYASGQDVQLSVTPNTDYRFSMWTGDVSSSVEGNKNISITINRDKSLTANFCSRCGDVNGDLTITPTDAQMIFELFLGKITNPTYCQKENADVNCDGTRDSPSITPSDAQIIFDHYLGKSGIPADCSCNSRTGSLGAFTPIAPASSEFNLMLPEIPANSEDVIYIPVSIDRSIRLNSFGFDIVYDASLFRFLGVGRTEITNDFLQVDGNVIGEGILRIGGYREASIENVHAGDLVFLIFKVIGKSRRPSALTIFETYDDLKKAGIN